MPLLSHNPPPTLTHLYVFASIYLDDNQTLIGIQYHATHATMGLPHGGLAWVLNG